MSKRKAAFKLEPEDNFVQFHRSWKWSAYVLSFIYMFLKTTLQDQVPKISRVKVDMCSVNCNGICSNRFRKTIFFVIFSG